MSDGNNSNNNAYFDFSREGQTLEDLFDTLAALDEEYRLGGRLLAALDKDKLDGIEEGAEVNKIAAIFVGDTELTPSDKVVTFQTDSEPTYGSVKLVLSGALYNKFVQYYTKSQVDSMIAALHQFVPVVADSLPEASADTMFLLYLIPSTNPKTRNAKDEFITIRSGEEGSYTYSWEQIGTTTIDIDGKEDKVNKVTSFSNPTDTQYPSAKLVSDSFDKVKADVSSLLTRAGIAEGIADTISAGTPQEFLQRQSGGDGVNCIKRIKGNTIAWNQLVKGLRVALGSATIVGRKIIITGNATVDEQSIVNVVGHKYCVRFTYNSSLVASSAKIRDYLTGSSTKDTIISSDSHKVSYISTPAYQKTDTINIVVDGYSSGTLEGYLICTDLTLLYGSKIAGLTDAEILEKFEKDYPLSDYAPASVLKSNDAAALLTDGRNQWDASKRVYGKYIDYLTGNEISNAAYSHTGYIRVLPNTQYYLKQGIDVTEYGAYYDADKNFISGLTNFKGLFTTPAQAAYVRITLQAADSSDNICINLSDASFNGTYEPYWQRVLALRLSELTGIPEGGTEADRVTMFPNGPGGAGSAFDSIFVENGVTKARGTMARVDLGTLTWQKVTGETFSRFYSDGLASTIKSPSTSDVLGNIICDKYTREIFSAIYTGVVDKACGITGADSPAVGNVNVIDSSLYASTATEFKTAVSGVILEYALATPIVYTDLQYADGTPFTMPATILVDDHGTERIQAPEGATTPSAPFCCDSNYSISIANLVKKLSNV